MIDGQNFFHQPVKNSLRTNDNILKIVSGLGDDYTTGCLLDYPCFKEHYKMIAINSSKQQELDADAKAIQQINFTGNTDWDGNTTILFIIEETKETILDFSKGTMLVLKLLNYFKCKII